MDRIGLFGGSFNPIHIGHLLIGRAALEELALDRLFYIPAAQSPFKPFTELAPSADRLRMLHLALAGQSRCEIDFQEIERGGVSYSIETVRSFVQRYPGAELWYLIGADHCRLLPKWRAADELARLAQFAVVPRPGEPLEMLPTPFRGKYLRGWPINISASEIRGRVQAGKPIDHLVPGFVEEVIRNKQLYL